MEIDPVFSILPKVDRMLLLFSQRRVVKTLIYPPVKINTWSG